MNNDRFKKKLAQLEKEREEYISRLSAEGQQEYRQKEDAMNKNLNNQDNSGPAFPKAEK